MSPNGISTSLPFDVQIAVRSIRAGTHHAPATRRVRFFDPRDLPSDQGVFAGQINGTTGQEGAQLTGNAARRIAGLEPWTPTRRGVLGVLVDDLIRSALPSPIACSLLAEFRSLRH